MYSGSTLSLGEKSHIAQVEGRNSQTDRWWSDDEPKINASIHIKKKKKKTLNEAVWHAHMQLPMREMNVTALKKERAAEEKPCTGSLTCCWWSFVNILNQINLFQGFSGDGCWDSLTSSRLQMFYKKSSCIPETLYWWNRKIRFLNKLKTEWMATFSTT